MSTLAAPARPLPLHRGRVSGASPVSRIDPATIVIRDAQPGDVPGITRLIADNVGEGRLLSRSEADIAAHVDDFIVAILDDRTVGCAALTPLSATTAELRSLVVAATVRAGGIGRRLVSELVGRAREAGFTRLTAFTHVPRVFVHAGFAPVPRTWVPEKLARDCDACALSLQCTQTAMMVTLDRTAARRPVHA